MNMYWIGRIHDATVRHDSDVVEMLSERDDTWFTTWGEAYSYWAVENSFNHSLEDSVLRFEPIDSVACRSATNAWNVPITWIANISSASVLDSSLPPWKLMTEHERRVETRGFNSIYQFTSR